MAVARSKAIRKRYLAYDEFNRSSLGSAWATTDTESKISTSGGMLVFAGGKATPAYDDPRVTYIQKSWKPFAGLTYETEMSFTSFGTSGCDFGFDTSNPVSQPTRPGFAVTSAGVLRAVHAQSAITRQNTPVTLSLNTTYRFRVVILSTTYGVLWMYSADRGKTWIPLFVDSQNPTAGSPLYIGLSNFDAAFSISYVKVFKGQAITPFLSDAFANRTVPGRADTGQPWMIQTGTANPTFAAGDYRSSGVTQSVIMIPTGVADGIWEATLNFGSAPSTSKTGAIRLRFRDLNNYVEAVFDRVNQQILLRRIANAVTTNVATLSSAGFADNTNYLMRVVAVGSTIRVYQDGIEKLSVVEPFGQYMSLASLRILDNLATPDLRFDNLKVWGTPRRPLFIDSFDRPDTSLDIGLADSGHVYTGVTDNPVVGTIWGIESGRAKYVNVSGIGTTNDRIAKAARDGTSFLVSGLIRTLVAASGVGGFLFRWQDSQNWSALRLIFTGNQVSALKCVAGVRTAIGTTTVPSMNADQDYRVDVIAFGNTMEVYVDGIRYLSLTVSDFPSTPAAGPYTTSGNIRVDDLRYFATSSPLAVHDTFTRVDSATTMGNTETPGSPWSVAGTWGIASNKAYSVTDASGNEAYVPFISADRFVEAVVSGTLNSETDYRTPNLLIARAADTRELILIARGGNLMLSKKATTSSFTTLATVATPTANGTDYTLRGEIIGNRFKGYKDGVLLFTYDMASDEVAIVTNPGGFVGMRLGKLGAPATAARWDNFKAAEIV